MTADLTPAEVEGKKDEGRGLEADELGHGPVCPGVCGGRSLGGPKAAPKRAKHLS